MMYSTLLGSNKIYFIKRADLIVSLFYLLALVSCSSNDQIVASVNDVNLNSDDATLLMGHLGYDVNNKSDWVIFLDQWTNNQMLKQELETTNPEKAKLVKLKAGEYSGELSKFYIEEQMIFKKLDSIVTDKQIDQYYLKHQNAFALQDYLVKALYIKTLKEIKVEDQLKRAYLLKNDKDLNQVNSYAKLYAENFYFDDEQWIYFSELTKDIPLSRYNKDNIVLNRTKTYFSDDQYVYYLNIIDFKLKDEIPPVEFLKPQIREIILSDRVNRLRETIQGSLYNNLKTKHDIQIHYH